MLRGLKKIRKSFNDAQQQRSRSSGSSSDNEENTYYYQEFERSTSMTTAATSTTTTGASTTVPMTTTTTTTPPVGTAFARNTSQARDGSTGGDSRNMSTTLHQMTKPSTKKIKIKKSSLRTSAATPSAIVGKLDKQVLLSKSTYLSSFDKCIEASDAMIASSYTSNSNTSTNYINNTSNNHNHSSHRETIFAVRNDVQTGLPDCSLLVSPDGDLLLVPNETNSIRAMFQPAQIPIRPSQPQQKQHPPPNEIDDDDDEDVGLNSETGETKITVTDYPTSSSSSDGIGNFSELMRQSKDDYESAMFVGNDLHGDKVINRFSAKGWSVPATTLAVQQTEFALQSLARFCEQYVLTRKDSAARMTMACDQWRTELDQRHGFQTNRVDELPMSGEQWEILDPRATSFELSPSRVGPLASHGSTINAAAMAIEQYHHEASEKEANRWRMATLKQRDGVLFAIQSSIDKYHTRATKRQRALAEMSNRAQIVEEQIRTMKQLSEKKWGLVYTAEQRVTTRMEELMSERSKERQKARLKLLLREQQQQQENQSHSINNNNNGTAATNPITMITDDVQLQLTCNLSDEVWDMVSSVAESMEHGSFEPIPDTASAISDEVPSAGGQLPHHQQLNNDRDAVLVSYPIVSREEIEQEMGVPELRAAARHVDETLQDESGTLLNIISLLDTTRRSARIAAETCLVSAGNAQATCLRNMLQLERESLQERLRDLDGLEQVLDKMDVRADLDSYIVADKKELGGCSHLGDDDDGGIASALAVLSSHVDGIIMGNQDSCPISTTTTTATSGTIPLSRQRVMPSSSEPQQPLKDISSGTTETDDTTEDVTTNMLNLAIDKVFQVHPALNDDETTNHEDKNTGTDDNTDGDDGKKYCAKFDKNVEFLCETITGNHHRVQKRRSALCYLLNSKRGMYAQIPTMKQYHAISQIFMTLLTNGMDDAEIGISNAKMCMMLAQTFYYLNDPTSTTSKIPSTNTTTGTSTVDTVDTTTTVTNTTIMMKTDEAITVKQTDVVPDVSTGTTADKRNGTDKSTSTNHHDHNIDDDILNDSITRTTRQYRMYIKNAILHHDIWYSDDFWDTALSQQISESLTHSGVMSNFDVRRSMKYRASRVKSQYEEQGRGSSSMTQWYDLNYTERVEAASQVHAVVFAQLGALAHSMIEFHCGLERSCAFVRRMSIRNQLPSSQRTMLLLHLMDRDDVGRRESQLQC